MEHLKACAACGEGLVRFDPATGDSRCGNCFSRGDPPPLVGGQGRSPESLRTSATVAGVCFALLAAVIVGAMIAAWVRS